MSGVTVVYLVCDCCGDKYLAGPGGESLTEQRRLARLDGWATRTARGDLCESCRTPHNHTDDYWTNGGT